MNSFEINKIIGWVLAAALVVVGGQTFMGIYSGGHGGNHEEKTAYAIEVADSGEKEPAAKEEEKEVDIKTLLATASVDLGAKIVKKCVACHTLDKGGANKVGPALYDLVNRDKASHEGFAYSDALKAKGGKWDYDALAAFLKSPSSYVPGTKMSFSGIRGDDKLASLIVYLRSLSDSPAKLP